MMLNHIVFCFVDFTCGGSMPYGCCIFFKTFRHCNEGDHIVEGNAYCFVHTSNPLHCSVYMGISNYARCDWASVLHLKCWLLWSINFQGTADHAVTDNFKWWIWWWWWWSNLKPPSTSFDGWARTAYIMKQKLNHRLYQFMALNFLAQPCFFITSII